MILVAILMLLPSCVGKDSIDHKIAELQIDEAFTLAAMDTVVQFNHSERQPDVDPNEIPENLWPAEISALDPIQVYFHNNNLAILLDDINTKINGIYVYVPISSFYPEGEMIQLSFGGETYIFSIAD